MILIERLHDGEGLFGGIRVFTDNLAQFTDNFHLSILLYRHSYCKAPSFFRLSIVLALRWSVMHYTGAVWQLKYRKNKTGLAISEKMRTQDDDRIHKEQYSLPGLHSNAGTG